MDWILMLMTTTFIIHTAIELKMLKGVALSPEYTQKGEVNAYTYFHVVIIKKKYLVTVNTLSSLIFGKIVK